MKVYTLTHTDTQQGFSPFSVRTFLSHEDAAREMESQFNGFHPEIKTKSRGLYGFVFDDGTENGAVQMGDCFTGYDYCYDLTDYWLIQENVLEPNFLIKANVLEALHKRFSIASVYDDNILRLINEYEREITFDFSSNVESIVSEIVGYLIYDMAVERLSIPELPRKTIVDFFNTEEFLNVLPYIEGEDESSHWFRTMLNLCSGYKLVVENTENAIKEMYGVKQEEKPKSQGKVVCSKCGSENIMLKYWYNPNTNECFGWDEADECYCKECGEMTEWKEI